MAQTDDFPFLMGKEKGKEKEKETKKEVELKKKIIENLQAHKDPSVLFAKLKEVRAEELEKNELGELQEIADKRAVLKEKASQIVKKVALQSKAISEFLEKRDLLIEKLKLLVDPLRELSGYQATSWEKVPGSCYLINDIGMFKALIKDLDQYLPAEFFCEFLILNGDLVDAVGKANEALNNFMLCFGILASFEKTKINK